MHWKCKSYGSEALEMSGSEVVRWPSSDVTGVLPPPAAHAGDTVFIGHYSNRHCLCLIKDNVLPMVHFAPMDKRLAQNGVETAEIDIRQVSN